MRQFYVSKDSAILMRTAYPSAKYAGGALTDYYKRNARGEVISQRPEDKKPSDLEKQVSSAQVTTP